MKKRLITLVFCTALLVAASMNLGSTQATAIESENKLAFLLALDKHLMKTDSYYKGGSVRIIDGVDLEGTVSKILQTDNPRTEENEEVIDEYTTQMVVAFVEFNQIRDHIFSFKKSEFYYYDLEKQEFLKANDVFMNKEVKSFFQSYMNDIHKELTTSSSALLLLLIFSTTLIFPLLIMIFHNKGRSTTNYLLIK